MSDLKPCPHCNGPAHIVIGDEFCRIRCSQCGATGGPADAIRESDAIAAWNRRPTETPASGEREGKQKRAERDQAMREESLTYIGPSPAPAGSDSGLVERLRQSIKEWHDCAEYESEQLEADALARIEQQAAEIRRLTEERDEEHGKAVLNLTVLKRHKADKEAAEARAEQAERERDEVKAAHEITAESYHSAIIMHAIAKARVKGLEAALEPFTKHYEPWMERQADCDRMTVYPVHTMGDLRRARAALKGE